MSRYNMYNEITGSTRQVILHTRLIIYVNYEIIFTGSPYISNEFLKIILLLINLW